MPNIRGPELLVLVLIIVVLFGAKRLPDAARGLGRSLRIFKAETKGLVDSDDPDAAEQPAEAARPAPQALPESAADSSPTGHGSPGSADAGPQHTAPEEPGAAQPIPPPAPPVPPTRA